VSLGQLSGTFYTEASVYLLFASREVQHAVVYMYVYSVQDCMHFRRFVSSSVHFTLYKITRWPYEGFL
jgi:hypothetical protein